MKNRQPVRMRALAAAAMLLLLAAAALSSAFAAEGSVLENVVQTGEHGFRCRYQGTDRSFTVYLPETPEGSPLIIALHGYASTAESFRLSAGLEKDANLQGYTVVYATGAPDPEDGTSATGWNYGKYGRGNDDVGFLQALADYIRQRYGTDESRVFAAGFSNGAFMAHRLAVEAGDTFSAVVSVAGSMSASVWENRPDTCKTGLLQITGEKDSVIPKHRDGSAKTAKDPAVEDVIGWYAEANGLEESETETAGKASTLTKYRDTP